MFGRQQMQYSTFYFLLAFFIIFYSTSLFLFNFLCSLHHASVFLGVDSSTNDMERHFYQRGPMARGQRDGKKALKVVLNTEGLLEGRHQIFFATSRWILVSFSLSFSLSLSLSLSSYVLCMSVCLFLLFMYCLTIDTYCHSKTVMVNKPSMVPLPHFLNFRFWRACVIEV